MKQHSSFSNVMETRDHSKNGASLKSHTSKRNILKIFSILAVSVLLFSCSKEDNDKNDFNNLPIGFIEPTNNYDLFRSTGKVSNNDGFIEATNNSDPYIFTDADENSLIALYRNHQTGIIQQALFVKDDKSFIMIYGIDGLPDGIFTEENYFLFSNYRERFVDISSYNINKELISIETVENDEIFNLIQAAASLSLRSNYSLRSDTFDDEFNKEMKRQALKVSIAGLSALSCFKDRKVISCGSAIIYHVKYFIDSFYPNFDKNGYLDKAAKYSTIASCVESLIEKDPLGIVICALSVVDSHYEKAKEPYDDNWEIYIPRKYANDYIKITTKVTNITSNSAVIIGELSLIGDGNRKYSIRFQGAEWGPYSRFTDGDQIDGSTPISFTFMIPAINLTPNTPYGAMAHIITDYYEDAWGRIIAAHEKVEGNIEPFQTLREGENSNWVSYNGLRIATRNVGASSPEDFGSFFQWNRSSPGVLEEEEYYKRGFANATSWTNNPCPAGYRLPASVEELRKIRDAAGLGKIILPASREMWNPWGGGIVYGWEYWSSLSTGDRTAMGLVESNMVDPYIYYYYPKHATALIRCVCEDK